MISRITNGAASVTYGLTRMAGPAGQILLLMSLLFLVSLLPAWSAEPSASGAGQELPLAPQVQSRLYRAQTDTQEGIVRLAPQDRLAEGIRHDLRTLQPRVGIETLVEAELQPALAELQRNDPDAILLLAYNALNDFSSMEGIEYYSASRARMRIYLHEAYRVTSPQDRTRREDPDYISIPDEARLFLYQRDSSFGRNVYEVVFRSEEDSLWMRLENYTPVFYSIAPIMSAHAAQIHITLDFDGSTMRFYAHMGMDVTSLFGMDERVQDSFTNRLLALYAWFASRLLQNAGVQL